ncbi:unnamed protein product [Protopolystoma xenopodis]|uniref:Uncharacterized protein n=1 Tax=Protopolystoma xenopodis TaxID=117903 RepID=A0A3S5AZG7_9PLAT|nr:unnamed protein product [Protopolystoma xenopodis]
MDELERLYEHQTMMAIGIYSFLDNLLSHVPPQQNRDDAEEGTNSINSTPGEASLPVMEAEALELRRQRIHSLRSNIARTTHLSDAGHLPPGFIISLSTSISGDISGEEEPVENSNLDTMSQPKCSIIAGGYSEEFFINLSDKEKEEFTCSVW